MEDQDKLNPEESRVDPSEDIGAASRGAEAEGDKDKDDDGVPDNQ